jgi:hypothetical protein
MPGTDANVGNEAGNWERRLPAIEELESILPQIIEVSDRK